MFDNNLWLEIFRFLRLSDLLRSKEVSKNFKELITSNYQANDPSFKISEESTDQRNFLSLKIKSSQIVSEIYLGFVSLELESAIKIYNRRREKIEIESEIDFDKYIYLIFDANYFYLNREVFGKLHCEIKADIKKNLLTIFRILIYIDKFYHY